MSGHLPRLLATFCGAGYAPVAPGTAGTLAALPLYLLLRRLPLRLYLLLLALLTLLGVQVSSRMEKDWGQDPARVVIDEVVGVLIALVSRTGRPREILAAFALFRLFDILKPPPVSTLERGLPGGVGIMADDMAAGALAAGILALVRRTGR